MVPSESTDPIARCLDAVWMERGLAHNTLAIYHANLTSLARQGQINLNQGVIRTIGKGDRERLVPLGEEAMDTLQEFTRGARA